MVYSVADKHPTVLVRGRHVPVPELLLPYVRMVDVHRCGYTLVLDQTPWPTWYGRVRLGWTAERAVGL